MRDSRSPAARQDRRDELADATVVALADLGYARASLREIAERSALSHGSVHYFFADKNELIGYAVRRHKFVCATRYDDVVATARTPGELRAGFAAALSLTLTADAPLHRLWYDVRHQAMFEPGLRDDVLAVESRMERMMADILRRYEALREDERAGDVGAATLTDSSIGAPGVDPAFAYATLDGLFERALLRHLSGDSDAPRVLVVQASDLFGHLYERPSA